MLVQVYWNSKNQTIDMPWNGSEGKALKLFLDANPMLSEEVFQELLENRANSEINHSARPREWLERVTDFANGPLNEFNRPIGVKTNAKFKGKTGASIDAATAAIETIENRCSSSETGYTSPSKAGPRGLPGIGGGSRAL
jgi:hypothetical protein